MPPITLSRGEFLRQRPGGNYAKYMRYVTNARADRAAARTNPITLDTLKQRIYESIPSLKQQRSEAQWLVNQSIKGQQDALREAALEEQQTAERQARAAEGFARAFQPMQASFDEAVRRAYANNASLISADASSLAAGLQASQENAAAQQAADVARLTPGVTAPVGTPGAGAGQLTGNAALAAGVPARIAASYTSGAAPISPLAPGAGYVSPQVARLADIGSQYRYKAIESATDLRKALAKLASKRPELLREAMKGGGEQNLQTLAALTNVLTLQNTMRETTSDIARTQADIVAGRAATKLAGRKQYVAEMAAQGLSPDGTPLAGFYVAPDGSVQRTPQQYTIGKNGKLKPLPYPPTLGTGKGGKEPKVASASDIETMQTSLLEAGRERLNLTTGAMVTGRKPKSMTKVQIANYLMATLGNSYVDSYANPAQVQRWVADVSERLYGELQDRLKKTKKTTPPKG